MARLVFEQGAIGCLGPSKITGSTQPFGREKPLHRIGHHSIGFMRAVYGQPGGEPLPLLLGGGHGEGNALALALRSSRTIVGAV